MICVSEMKNNVFGSMLVCVMHLVFSENVFFRLHCLYPLLSVRENVSGICCNVIQQGQQIFVFMMGVKWCKSVPYLCESTLKMKVR